MNKKRFSSRSEEDTNRLGQAIGQLLLPGFVIALNGTLGAGKTRLTQAIGRALGIEDGNVVSPTFTICTPHEGGRLPLIHLDAYRIKSDEEVDELGLDEIVDGGAVLIVEWAERIHSLLPEADLSIEIEVQGESERLFQLSSATEKGKSLINGLDESKILGNEQSGN